MPLSWSLPLFPPIMYITTLLSGGHGMSTQVWTLSIDIDGCSSSERCLWLITCMLEVFPTVPPGFLWLRWWEVNSRSMPTTFCRLSPIMVPRHIRICIPTPSVRHRQRRMLRGWRVISLRFFLVISVCRPWWISSAIHGCVTEFMPHPLGAICDSNSLVSLNYC